MSFLPAKEQLAELRPLDHRRAQEGTLHKVNTGCETQSRSRGPRGSVDSASPPPEPAQLGRRARWTPYRRPLWEVAFSPDVVLLTKKQQSPLGSEVLFASRRWTRVPGLRFETSVPAEVVPPPSWGRHGVSSSAGIGALRASPPLVLHPVPSS